MAGGAGFEPATTGMTVLCKIAEKAPWIWISKNRTALCTAALPLSYRRIAPGRNRTCARSMVWFVWRKLSFGNVWKPARGQVFDLADRAFRVCWIRALEISTTIHLGLACDRSSPWLPFMYWHVDKKKPDGTALPPLKTSHATGILSDTSGVCHAVSSGASAI